ncbi:hemerythrin domain-containing protein [Sandaracinus amylolyticus]|uniref:Regulator protein n=1 Tax=Sandaracinus amylolyticus TaxID=927083 RepID=A0A0F6YHC4_9BACT|nr:hemerythrin domain-containing protein [Sandaracinus amylolyticus]AKF03863.1 Regulator protein [Sandaracinus amylolyticus]
MKATDLLEQQHREVEKIFDRLENDEGDRIENLRELASKLAAHMRIEEEIFYPKAREVMEDMVFESLEEHTLAAFALKRLAEIDPGHPSFEAKCKALKELVKHHVEEEESEMFPKIDGEIEPEELETIGEELEARFMEIVESGYGAELVKGQPSKKNGIGRMPHHATR